MRDFYDEFLKDDNLILVIPVNKDKPVKIVYDNYQTSYDEESMILSLTEMTTIGSVASRMGMSVEEFLSTLEEVD